MKPRARTPLLALALALLSLLSGCADKAVPPPSAAAAPPPQPPQPADPQNWLRPSLFFATSRNVLDPGSETRSARFGGLRSRETSYGECRLGISGAGAGAADRMDVKVTLERTGRLTRARFLADLQRAAARTPRREVLLFIHGFDNSFEDAAKTATRIAHGVGFAGAAALYSWPSAGSAASYLQDRNNAYWSVHYLKEFLADVLAAQWIDRVSVVVHSMGNEVFIRACAELADEYARTGNGDLRKLKNIVLAAPDMDREIFLDQYAAKLMGNGARIVLYASRSDMALAASAQVQGGDYERLGKNVVCIPGLNVTDVSDVKTDLLGHSWIADSRSVLTDLRCVLTEGCNRYAGKLLQEYVCPREARYHLPLPGSQDRATSGETFWRLNVTDGPTGPALGGYKLSLPW
ncbi:MAG: alpha/beta hydrolase [Proteobacteria bacterium]|nr:alpha/beta hydrolase [Pseudomonadota bacterium]MBU1595026.1 alpha/beta hydrolase [Pseudomonadota bacterium]